jgi:hypothetical protein
VALRPRLWPGVPLSMGGRTEIRRSPGAVKIRAAKPACYFSPSVICYTHNRTLPILEERWLRVDLPAKLRA